MKIKTNLIILLGLFLFTSLQAQESRTEICIDFRLNSHTIDSTYMDNASRLDELMCIIKQLHTDTTKVIVEVTFSGVASPEGNSQINQRLAQKRMLALENYVRTHISLPENLIIRHSDYYIPWHYLINKVETSDISYKQEVLSILRSPRKYVPYYNNTTIDSRVPALQKLDGGRVWRTLSTRYFAQMRHACAVFATIVQKPELEPIVVPEPVDTMTADTAVVVLPIVVPQPEAWVRRIYVKTNTIGLSMGIANAAVEIDMAKHWSFTLPVYYSAWDYFTSDVKFRTLCFQPEVRYWLREDHAGWFAGAHFGLAWFNYAKGSDWRYQDHEGDTPLVGGGISGGYRMPISKNGKWWMEFSLGAGAYGLHYDIFHNEPNGQLVDTRKRTFYGIDQAAISFAYRFDLKKGGKQ